MRKSTILGALLGLAAALSLGACEDEPGQPPASLAGDLLGGHQVEAAGLSVEVPNTWKPVAPDSPMRKAQVQIPGAGGEAEMAVFHFGEGKGGSVEDNLLRWVGQMKLREGGEPQRDYFESGRFAATVLTARGTLRAGRMGMGPKQDQPGSMLIGAVVEGPGGPWFFKATGPEETLAAQRDAFVAMLESAQRSEKE